MTHNKTALRRLATAGAAIALAAGLAACGDDDNNPTPTPTPTPTMTASPTPTPTTASVDVTPCLQQVVFPDGTTVQDLVIPDVLTIDPTLPAGFPNGRKPNDQVIDITLAALLLDLSADGQSARTFADLPLDPPQNDIGPTPDTFPFLLPPQGSPPIAANTGTTFNFRTDPDGDFVRVDRMGFPAVSTALVPSDLKVSYNNARPEVDATGKYASAIVGTLTDISTALNDDLTGLGLTPCATSSS